MKTEDYKRLTYNENDGWKEETVRRLTFNGSEDWKQHKLSEEEIMGKIEKLKCGGTAKPQMGSISELLFDLLDLYQKEKEKNIKAGELLGKRINMCNQFQIELDKQKEKNKELEETLKCTQNSWYEDTKELHAEKEENKNLELCLKAEEKRAEGLENDIKSLLNIEPNDNFIAKSQIKAKIEEIKDEEDLYAKGNILTILEELLEEGK